MTKPMQFCHLGLTPYREAWTKQEAVHAAVLGGMPSTLLFCQHPHVVSKGSRSDEANILLSEEAFKALGAEVIQSNRGGDVTYHGPGQIVGYPIFRLLDAPKGQDLHAFLRAIEEILIQSLADFGLVATRREGKTGAWIGDRKIAAIGLRASRWITMHGFALNLEPDLAWFSRIVPCGLSEEVTSMKRELGGHCPSEGEVHASLVKAFASVLDLNIEELVLATLDDKIDVRG